MTQNTNNMMQIVMKAAKGLYDNEKFLVSYLAARADTAAHEHPYDSTLVGLSNFLNRKASTPGSLLISRAELKDVYNKLYTNKTKAALYFSDELGLSKETAERPMLRNPKEGETLAGMVGDSFLRDQLSSVLSHETPTQYSVELAKEAKEVCARELARYGLPTKRIEIMAGNTEMLLCSAQCDTPKGSSHILVPIEAKQGRALLPSLFLTTEGFVSLNKEHLVDHLQKTAGKYYKIDAQKLLQDLTQKKEIKTLSNVQQIVLKTAAEKGSHWSFDAGTPNSIYINEIDPKQHDLETVSNRKDVELFQSKLSSDSGAAQFVHGRQAVDKGRQLVMAELAAAGHRQAQVSVAGVSEEGIKFAVSIGGRAGFHVPVKVTADKVMAPSVVVASGKAYNFNPAGINKLISESSSDPMALVRTASSYGQKPSELIEVVRSSLVAGKWEDAEQALHVLSTSGDKIAYQAGYNLYRQALTGQPLDEKTSCSAPIKVANSQYLICSHTNLPVHKVYQDKYGNCQPLYRKHMAQTSEGGISLNSKIFRQ